MKGIVYVILLFITANIVILLLSKGTVVSTLAAGVLFWLTPVIPVAITDMWE